MQNNKLSRLIKGLNARLYSLCGFTAAEVKYIEKIIIDMAASRSRRNTQAD